MGVRFLDRFWDRTQYEIGGGTVLAARWHHRYSNDVDCFMDENTFRSTYERNRELITEALRELETSGRLTARHHSSRMLIMEFADLGEMFLVSGGNLTPTQDTSECEASTGIRLESTADILAKKLAFRVLEGRWKQRDFFDLIVASRCAPLAFQTAMNVLTEAERDEIAEILRVQLECATLEMGEIKEPYHPHVAEKTWVLAANLFEGKEIDLPPIPEHSSVRERDDDFGLEL